MSNAQKAHITTWLREGRDEVKGQNIYYEQKKKHKVAVDEEREYICFAVT